VARTDTRPDASADAANDPRADLQSNIRASRRRIARSRGALSGVLLVVLGAWAALVPFIGPYFNLGFTPRPNSEWHWTAARGWLEVLPGAAAFLGGLILLLSASRAMTVFAGWLAALGGAWLVVGPALAPAIKLHLGQPDPSLGTNNRSLAWLLYFYAIGAAIVFFASLALGRVSVLSVRDVRAAERRAEAEEAERQAALRAAAEQERERRRAEASGPQADAAGRHSADGSGETADRGEPQRPPQYTGGPQHPNGPQYPNGPQQAPHQEAQHAPQQPGGYGSYPPPSGPAGQYPAAPPPPPREG
jgi:hypothetical protein